MSTSASTAWNRREHLVGRARCGCGHVVKLDDARDRVGELPVAQQIGPDLGVRGTHELALENMSRRGQAGRAPDGVDGAEHRGDALSCGWIRFERDELAIELIEPFSGFDQNLANSLEVEHCEAIEQARCRWSFDSDLSHSRKPCTCCAWTCRI